MSYFIMPCCLPGGIDGVEPANVAEHRKKAKMAKPVLKKETRTQVVYRGLTQAARSLGCSRAHLSYVLHGKRKASERLARALKRMGVEVEVA